MPDQEKNPKAERPTLSPHFAKRWEFVQWLKSGGQADPYEVRERETAVAGVLKQPKKLDAIAIERFRREIAVVQECYHPALVRLLDFSLDEQQIGYVTPRGRLLREFWAETRGALSPTALYDLAFRFMASIAEGLAVIHDKNVVHRDLKAANVIVLDRPSGPQPVVIDFGLVFREGDERLSHVNGRLVNNLDTSPAESYYRHIDPTPAWDCIGLGWLYGFLVGAGRPDNNRFHWKFHPLVEEPRARRVRALLAQCSDLDYAPTNARGFRLLMDNLGLGGTTPTRTEGGTDFFLAAVALKDAQAARRIREIEQAEQFQVLSAAFDVPLTELRSALDDVVANVRGMPVTKVNANQTSRSFDEHFRAAFSGDEPQAVPFFWIQCGSSSSNNFYICGYLEYEPRNRQPGDILFNLRFDCRHSKNQWNLCDRFFFERDGSFTDSQTGVKRKVPNSEIVDHVSQWLARPQHWAAIG